MKQIMEYLYFSLISLAISIIVTVILIKVLVHNKREIKQLKENLSYEDVKTYEDLLDLFSSTHGKIRNNADEINELDKRIQYLSKKDSISFKYVGLVRYKYSDDAGGNLSFSLAIMDDEKNGLVFTNIALIDNNSLYLRRIKNGASDILLMQEEQEAIEQAIQSAI